MRITLLNLPKVFALNISTRPFSETRDIPVGVPQARSTAATGTVLRTAQVDAIIVGKIVLVPPVHCPVEHIGDGLVPNEVIRRGLGKVDGMGNSIDVCGSERDCL